MKWWRLVQWNKREAHSEGQSQNSRSPPPNCAAETVWEPPSLWPSASDIVIPQRGKKDPSTLPTSPPAPLCPPSIRLLLTPRCEHRGARASLPRDRALRREVMPLPHPRQEPEGAWQGPWGSRAPAWRSSLCLAWRCSNLKRKWKLYKCSVTEVCTCVRLRGKDEGRRTWGEGRPLRSSWPWRPSLPAAPPDDPTTRTKPHHPVLGVCASLTHGSRAVTGTLGSQPSAYH